MKEKLFIIGNGFDLSHGLKSSYLDFREFLVANFPNINKYEQENIYVEDFINGDKDEFAAKMLLDLIDIASNSNWSNFEDALAKIDIDSKLPKRLDKAKEIENPQEIIGYLKAVEILSNIICECYCYWQKFFYVWAFLVNDSIELIKEKEGVKQLFTLSKNHVISFNYTSTLEKIYNINNVTHIHNKIGEGLIWGHGEKNATYNTNAVEFVLSTTLDDFIKFMYKDSEKQVALHNEFFNELNRNIYDVYSYGFSYGKADSLYIKKIIKKINKKATWYFTKFESLDKESLRIKKIKLRSYGFKGKFAIFYI